MLATQWYALGIEVGFEGQPPCNDTSGAADHHGREQEPLFETYGEYAQNLTCIWHRELDETVRFVFDTDFENRCSVICYGDGYLTALNKWTGSIIWEQLLSDVQTVLIDGNTIVVQIGEEEIKGVDINNGTSLWTVTFPSVIRALSTLDGVVVSTTVTNQIVAIELSSGTQLWNRSFDTSLVRPILLRWYNFVVTGHNRTVEAFHLKNGSSVWSIETPRDRIVDIRYAGACCVFHIVCVTDTGYVFDITPYGASIRWDYDFQAPVRLAPWDGFLVMVFYVPSNNTLIGLNDFNGLFLWCIPLNETLVFESMIFLFTFTFMQFEDGTFVAFDTCKGTVAWSYHFAQSLTMSMFVYNNNVLLIDGTNVMAKNFRTGTSLFELHWNSYPCDLCCLEGEVYVSHGTNLTAVDVYPTSFTLTSPEPNSWLSTPMQTLTGSIRNDEFLYNVWVKVGAGEWITAPLSTGSSDGNLRTYKWLIGVALERGENIVHVRTATLIGQEHSVWHNTTFHLYLDDLKPGVAISHPINGSRLTTTKVNLTGTAWDNNPGLIVSFSADNYNWQQASMSPSQRKRSSKDDGTNYTVSWYGTLELGKGMRNIYISATDIAGNQDIKIVEVMVVPEEVVNDTSPPELEITSPSEQALLNTSEVQFSGEAHDENDIWKVELSIDNGQWAVVEGLCHWNATLQVIEGNHTVRIRAYDSYQNVVETARSFFVDSTLPEITINFPIGSFVNTSDIIFNGSAEDGCGVHAVMFSIDGLIWSLTTGTENWSAPLHLQDGKQQIWIKAIDRAGNEAVLGYNLTLDQTSPSGSVYSAIKDTRNDMLDLKGVALDNYGIECVAASTDLQTWHVMTGTRQWEGSVPIIDRGCKTVTIKITDMAGNVYIETISLEEGTGEDNKTSEPLFGDTMIYVIGALLVVIVIIALVILFMRRRAKR